jgi:hypothetical protein
MLRLITGLAALLMAGPALAGELDREYSGKKTGSPAVSGKSSSPSNNAALAQRQSGTENARASELDEESPTQAYRRGGWGGGWRGGWGGGWRGGYWGGYRGWGGYYGWRRPWGGYWGGPYVGIGIGYPSYYGYPSAYPYYTSYYFP